MASVVLAGLDYISFEIYIDDVMIRGRSEDEFLVNLRKVRLTQRKPNLGGLKLSTLVM